MRAQICPQFAWYALVQPVTMLVGTTIEGAVLVSLQSVGVGSAIILADTTCEGAALESSLGRRLIKKPLW